MKKLIQLNPTFFYIFFWTITGISLTVGINGLFESNFEDEILENIAHRIVDHTKGQPEEAVIDSTIKLCFFLQERRSLILGNSVFHTFKATQFRSSLQSFYIGTGACGYYSLFAARVFQQLGYRPKIVQQRVNNNWGGHITLVVPLKSEKKTVLVDPLFKHIFRDSLHRLAEIQEVKSHWDFYRKNVPSNYNPAYNYQQGWRHTNWDKYGLLSRSFYNIGCVIYGKQRMDGLSMRTYIIDPYHVQFVLCMILSSASILGLILTYLTTNYRGAATSVKD